MRFASLESDTRDIHQCGDNFVPCNMDILDSGTVRSVSPAAPKATIGTASAGLTDQTYYQYYVGDDAAQTPKRKNHRQYSGDGSGISPPVHTLSHFIFKQEARKPIATRRYGSPLSPIDTSQSSLTHPEMHEVSRNTPITPLSPWSRQGVAYSPTESPYASTVTYPVSESRERSPSHQHRVRQNQSFRGTLCL